MPEQHNIEWKESWRDEYLKWICGFANAQGGKLIIGKDDKGNIIGTNKTERLLEDIPNKAKDVLGIIVDVNLNKSKEGHFIEILIDDYPYPVNYKGKYYYRTGSTIQELKGAALDKFMLQKKGKKWDAIPVPNVNTSDLKEESFEFFKKRALQSKRIEEEAFSGDNELIIENLQLKERKFLKHAAILLFHPKPEKFVTGAYIKIGFFESDADLIFQDEVHGNLFEQVEKTMNLLFSKYIKAIISYKGLQRVETYEYPVEAVREALLNAVSHKDYPSGVPIQISVYNHKLMIWNAGHLPDNWTVEDLLIKHPSNPNNPDIANAFFRSGYVESWGRGTIKMIEICKDYEIPVPKYKYQSSGFWVEFRKDIYNEEYLKSLELNDRQINAVLFTKKHQKITNKDYQKLNDCSRNTASKELGELVYKKLLKSSGQKGAGSHYKLL